MTMFGRAADDALALQRGWSRHLMSCLEAFASNPAMLERSVQRHFDNYRSYSNIIREACSVAKKGFNNDTWKGFIQCSLTAAQKEQYASWDIEDADVWDGLAVWGEAGYRFSLTWNKGNSNWVATYTGQEGSGKNEGWAVTAFGKTPYAAARVLLFKVQNVLPDIWSNYKPSEQDEIG